MDQKNKKRYVEKQPPDKINKTKYVQKKEQTSHQQYSKIQKDNSKVQSFKYKQKPKKQEKKQFKSKLPQFQVKKTSQSIDASCLICSQNIDKRQPIWTCLQCFKYIHLRCMKKWIQNVNKQTMASNQKKKFIYNWTCPQCKYQYNEPMPEYYCFCGRQKNPQYIRDLQPHSCGKICGRKRGPYCVHNCPIPCHSGKCPPCDNQGTQISCNCGKTQRVVKCSEQRQVFQCGKKCDKILNCHKHKCQKNCHKGPCNPCNRKRMVDCHCGKNKDVVNCVEVSFNCGEICEKQLNCGFHKCSQKCHEGQCANCKRTPQIQKSCPCGRNSLMLLTGDENFRKSCKDPIPICGMPCKKTLLCGHYCNLSCHDSPCPLCKITVQQNCDCGLTSRKVECYIATSNKQQHRFKCDNICKRKKTCGQHTCNEICCKFRNSILPQDHKCQLACPKTLNCKKHTCGQLCHVGLCKKCPVVYSQPQPCPCGSTSLRPPIICGTFVPQCNNICNKQLDCGHKCQMKCHYGPCKCYQPIQVVCRCGKDVIQTTCGKQALCLNKCKQLLECGHQCGLQCHKGSCKQAHQGHPCKKNCDKKRQSCDHLCTQPCHLGKKCQQFSCQAQILIKCQCGNRKTTIICGNLDKKHKKSIICNKRCENVKRFDALYKDKQIYYPNGLFQFGFKNFAYLEKLQAKLNTFISQSQEPFLQIEFKFMNDNNARTQLINLFQNHYHLNTHFYKYRQHASFTVMQTDDTMIPKPSLTQYIKQASNGKIKRNNLPFEYTIKFECLQKEKAQLCLKALNNYKHRYYVQKKEKYLIHFWDKNDGFIGLGLMKQHNPGFQFTGQQNIVEKQAQDSIEQGQIFEEDVKQQQINQKQKQKQNTNQKGLKIQKSNEKVESKNNQDLDAQKEVQIKKQSDQKAMIGKQSKKQKPKIIFRNQPFFQQPEYPPAKNFVQQIYYLDEDQLYNQKIQWKKYVSGLIQKNIGPEASQWRLRSILMINNIEKLDQKIILKQFQRLIKMYSKDKQKAARILELQKLDVKKIKAQMDQNGIYLSNFEPQFMSYAKLFNYYSHNKIQGLQDIIAENQQLFKTIQMTKAIEIIQYVEKGEGQNFFNEFKSADFMFSLLIKNLIIELRENIIEMITLKSQRLEAKNLYRNLFFKSQQQLLYYFQLFERAKLDKKFSKTKSCQVYFINEKLDGIQKEQLEKKKEQFLKDNMNWIESLVRQKRDKKFFLAEPQQMIDGKLMTRSFFAFGDFKESINPKYMNDLCRKLKKQN